MTLERGGTRAFSPETPLDRDWRGTYAEKLITPAEAVSLVPAGGRVGVPMVATPRAIVRALASAAGDLDSVRVGPWTPLGPDWEWLFTQGVGTKVFPETLFLTPLSRSAFAEDRADWSAPYLGSFPRLADHGRRDIHRYDVYCAVISQPDVDGYCSFGTSPFYSKYACQNSRVVIGEVDPGAIRTYGDNFIHISRIDHLVETEAGIDTSGYIYSDDTPVERESERAAADVAAAYAASVIHDGDTVQIGIGRASAALYDHLRGHRQLGVHSEMVEEAVLDLVDSGVIDGSRKTLDRGKVVTSWLRASPRALDRVACNPMYELRGTDYVDDPRVVSRLENFVAVNSAVSIDLTGQVNSEWLNGTMYSGPGGQLDLMIGASLSPGGRSILLTPSTAGNGRFSRIVPTFDAGTVVTVPRTLVDFVATEYGIVNLMGRTLRERAKALCGIAHPDFRADLKREMQAL